MEESRYKKYSDCSLDDLELIGLDLLDTTNNSSRFTFITKKDNYIVQMDNKSYKGD